MDAVTLALAFPALATMAAEGRVAGHLERRCELAGDVRGCPADPVGRWQPLVAEASRRFGIPEPWIMRVMRAESGGRTLLGGRPIRSPRGAMGLMQLMPNTWADLRRRLGLGSDPDDPRDNILAGTLYLRLMYDRFGYPGLFGAYNAGPGRYAAWLAGRARLPAETVAYLGKVGTVPPLAHGEPSAASSPRLFVVLREQERERERADPAHSPEGVQPAKGARGTEGSRPAGRIRAWKGSGQPEGVRSTLFAIRKGVE